MSADDPMVGQDHAARIRFARLAELGVSTASLLHELRQPLFAVQALAELALREEGADAARWRKVLEQARHMELLVGRYGGLQRSSGQVEVFDLNAPVLAALDMMGHRAERLAVGLDRVLAPSPLPVRAVRGALRQVTVNLVQNAMDAVEGRAVRRVTVATSLGVDGALLEVTDTGPGMRPEMVDRVFDAFVSSKPPERGTGLGLYITRLLVDEADGDIDIDSVPGEGTTVRVRVPAA